MEAKTLNGAVQILAYLFALIVRVTIGAMEYTSASLDHLKWTNGRKQNLNKWNLEEMQEQKNIILRII